jgi:hypothetical protein
MAVVCVRDHLWDSSLQHVLKSPLTWQWERGTSARSSIWLRRFVGHLVSFIQIHYVSLILFLINFGLDTFVAKFPGWGHWLFWQSFLGRFLRPITAAGLWSALIHCRCVNVWDFMRFPDYIISVFKNFYRHIISVDFLKQFPRLFHFVTLVQSFFQFVLGFRMSSEKW